MFFYFLTGCFSFIDLCINSWRPSSISLKVFLVVDWAFSSLSTPPSNLWNLLSRIDTAVLKFSSLLSIVSSLTRMRSTFDSKFSCISTTSTTSECTSAERSGEEFELDRISLALFSSNELPEVLESAAFPGFSFSIHANYKPKTLLRSETLGSGKKTRLLAPHTSTQSQLLLLCHNKYRISHFK